MSKEKSIINNEYLHSFRQGWQSEHLARYILSKFAFISGPATIADDLGVDFYCTAFTVDKNKYCQPLSSFAIQIKSNKGKINITKKLDSLSKLQIPYFVGIIDKNNQKLDIFSSEALNHIFTKYGTKLSDYYYNEEKGFYNKVNIILKENFNENQEETSYYYNSDIRKKELNIIFPRIISIESSFNINDNLDQLKQFYQLIELIQYNISLKNTNQLIFKISKNEINKAKNKIRIYAGCESIKVIRPTFFNKLAELFYNINWECDQLLYNKENVGQQEYQQKKQQLFDEFIIYEKLYIDICSIYNIQLNSSLLTSIYKLLKKTVSEKLIDYQQT